MNAKLAYGCIAASGPTMSSALQYSVMRSHALTRYCARRADDINCCQRPITPTALQYSDPRKREPARVVEWMTTLLHSDL
jgi:hypothetical protein